MEESSVESYVTQQYPTIDIGYGVPIGIQTNIFQSKTPKHKNLLYVRTCLFDGYGVSLRAAVQYNIK